MLFPFSLAVQMWVVAVLSDLTQMLSLSIVCRGLLGVGLLGWKGNSLSVFSSLREVQLGDTKDCSCCVSGLFSQDVAQVLQ